VGDNKECQIFYVNKKLCNYNMPAKTFLTVLIEVRFEDLTASSLEMRVFWDIAPYSLARVDRRFRRAYIIRAMMMEAVRTSETSVYCSETIWRYIPEDSRLQS
jgi:hypothetical protein